MAGDGNAGPLCVYCGESADTKDHVPPRSWFPKPRPADLITVPACEDCNASKSNDEDDVRTMLTMARPPGETAHPAAIKIWNTKASRMVKRNKHRVNDFYRKAGRRDVYKGDIYVETAAAFQPDFDKIERVFGNIVRGLNYHEHGTILPNTYDVLVRVSPRQGDVSEEVVGALRNLEQCVRGGGIMRYLHFHPSDREDVSFWGLQFYDNPDQEAIALTAKKDEIRSIKGSQRA